MTVVILSFAAFLLVFTVIGILSSFRRKDTTEDYLVAGRNVAPWLAALSAVATNNSGFMFVGLIGYTYTDGIESVWMMVGWLLGDLVAWLTIHRRVRERSERVDVASVPSLLGTRIDGTVQRPVVVASGLLTFVFLGAYAAAQLKAGSIALESLFGWPEWVGALVGAVIVAAYCFSGGLRASIWTDAAQSFVMILAMGILFAAGVGTIGGPGALLSNLRAQDPTLVDLFPDGLRFGFLPFVLGMAFGGFGVVGQPHILIRNMAIKSPEDIPRAARTYFLWFVPFFVFAIAVGLYARAILPDLGAASAERALPEMSRVLLPDFLVGMTLAGLFSATMSTADSQLLSCSAAVTQDVFPSLRNSYRASKAATLGVTVLALGIALGSPAGVFDLVLVAWSVLGAGLGPILVLRVLGQKLETPLALSMMIVGASVVIIWQRAGLDGDIFKLLPGMLAAFSIYAVWRAAMTLREPSAARPAK